MTKDSEEERLKRLRQDPDYKELVRILKGQPSDRVEAFYDKCEAPEQDEEQHETARAIKKSKRDSKEDS